MKILVTAAVIVLGWLAVRDRWRSQNDGEPKVRPDAGGRPGEHAPLVPRGAVKLAAYGLVLLMLVGTGVYLFQGWQRDREIVELQVVNAYTGEIEPYEARRGGIDRRSFTTLDGRRVQIAEMERLIVIERER